MNWNDYTSLVTFHGWLQVSLGKTVTWYCLCAPPTPVKMMLYVCQRMIPVFATVCPTTTATNASSSMMSVCLDQGKHIFFYVNILVCSSNDCGIILIQDCNCICRMIFITQYFNETYEDDFWLLIWKFIFQNSLMFKICGVIFYLWNESNRAWYKTVTVGTEKLYGVSCFAQ